MEEVVRRIDAIVGEAIDDGDSIEIVMTAPRGDTHDPAVLPADFRALGPLPLVPVPGPDDWEEEEEVPPPVWHVSTVWRPGLLSETFRNIADGTGGSVLLLNSRHREVASPYEGGVDVIGPTGMLRRVRRRFRSWLADHSDGL